MVTLQVERTPGLGGKLLQHRDGGGGRAKKMKKLDSFQRRHAGMSHSLPPSPATETTPNYMKPTTCSDARKEQLPVRIRSPNSNCTRDGSNLHRKGTKPQIRWSNSKLVRVFTNNPSFKAPVAKRCSPIVLCENLDARRATCSSTLKDRKFPAFLEFNHGGTESEGTSAIKVCPCTYCSLNGFHHAPLPPLRCFLSAKRAQRRINLGCGMKTASDGLNFDKKLGKDDLASLGNGVNGEEDRVWFIEILSEKAEGKEELAAEVRGERVGEMACDDVCVGESDDKGLDSGFELGAGGSVLGDIAMEWDGKSDTQIAYHELLLNSGDRADRSGELSLENALQESNDQGFNSDGESGGSVQSLVTMECLASVEVPMEEPEPVYDVIRTLEINLPVSHNVAELEPLFGNLENNLVEGPPCHTESSHEDHTSNVENQVNPAENMETLSTILPAKRRMVHRTGNAAEPETADIIMAFTRAKRKKSMQESNELGTFNPREPNFLPLEPDPEAEKVDLRHQELNARKNMEEWMVDYALRQVVSNLGPARKRKVALLVEAFEKVLPITNCDVQLGHASSTFDLARPIQACR